MSRPGEDALIARYFAPLAGPGGLGLADDAALLAPPPGCDLVLTTDALVAGIHFFPDDPPRTIGIKALGVNLSDLAAKGAEPVGYLLTLALPGDWTEPWLAAFCDGLGEAGRRAGCELLGGDTVRTSGPLTLSITALGRVPTGRMVRRTSAAPGQRICVTGTIGDAGLGLALLGGSRPGWADALPSDQAAFLVDRYRCPQPRSRLAVALRDHAAAALDVSDGFAGDLAKMLRVSRVGGLVDLDRIPLSAAARTVVAAAPGLFDGLLAAGDDYEILCTVGPDRVDALSRAAAAAGIAFAVVGDTRPEHGLAFRRRGADYAMAPRSFSHF